MSHDDWEGGTLVLPSTAVVPLKRALRLAANGFHATVLAECLRLWTGPLARTTSADRYIERLDAALLSSPVHNETVSDAVIEVMFAIVGGQYRDGLSRSRQGSRPRPRAPKPTDVEHYAPRATVRSSTFGAREEWSIRIEGHQLRYRSGENNHQVERARHHPVVAAMFAALARVVWTRGSGGAFVGNDEYNRDDRGSGGGRNYITADYGPLGEAERAGDSGMSLARYRSIMKPKTQPRGR